MKIRTENMDHGAVVVDDWATARLTEGLVTLSKKNLVKAGRRGGRKGGRTAQLQKRKHLIKMPDLSIQKEPNDD